MIDKTSPTWAHIKKWADGELKAARGQLETSGLDMATTEKMRGKIAALKNLLLQVEDKPEIPEFNEEV